MMTKTLPLTRLIRISLASLTGLMVVVGLATLTVGYLHAQTNSFLSLAVNPPVAYLTVKPGETVNHAITLTYEGSTPITITPSLVNFNPAERGQGIELEETYTFPYLDTSKPNPFQQAITLEPGKPTRVEIPISVPNNATTHEFHLSVLFSADPSQNVLMGSTQTKVVGTIGSNLIVLVATDNRDLSQLSIKSVQGARMIDSFGEIDLKVLANNTGPTATIASGSAVIKNGRGHVVQRYDIYPDMILANSSRLLRVVEPGSLNTTDENSSWQPATSITHRAPLLVGQYTLEVSLVDQAGVSQTNHLTEIWALPFSIIIVLTIALILAGVYLISVKKLPIGKRIKTY